MRTYYVIDGPQGLPRVSVSRISGVRVLAECKSLDEAREVMKKVLDKRKGAKNGGNSSRKRPS